MQSLYRVIKSTVVEGKNVIAPPVISIPVRIDEDIVLDSVVECLPDLPDENEIKIAETEAKVQEMLMAADDEARQIIEKAKAEALDIKKSSMDEGFQEGYKNGYKDGYDFGINEANNEGENIRSEAEACLKSAHEEVNNFITKSKNEIIKLAVEISRHILNTELTINTEAVFKIAEKAVSKAVDKKQIIIKTNPEYFNILKNKKEDLSIYVEDSNNIFIIADSSIKQGSVKIETPSGFVDADINTQLGLVLKSLTGEGYNA